MYNSCEKMLLSSAIGTQISTLLHLIKRVYPIEKVTKIEIDLHSKVCIALHTSNNNQFNHTSSAHIHIAIRAWSHGVTPMPLLLLPSIPM